MLTSFFAQSKPINQVAIVGLVLTFFVFYHISVWPAAADFGTHLYHITALLAFTITLGVLNFVVKRNILTKKSTYIIYFFALYSLSLPIIFETPSVVFSGFFIMLALRRIISLRTHLEVQKKVFDAALWIFVASIFYFWSVLFIIVLYMGILLHAAGSYKNWLIPLVSLAITTILFSVYALYSGDTLSVFTHYVQTPDYDFSAYNNIRVLIPISFFLGMYFWCIFRYMGLLRSASQKMRPSYVLIILSSLIALVIAAVFAPGHDGSEVYFLLGPLAIITSRYVDKSVSKLFPEMLMWLTLCLPILILIL